MILPAMIFPDFRYIARRGLRAAATLVFALAAALPASAAPPVGGAHPVTARLVAEATSVAPGTTLWVDLHLDIAPGWHTYWLNPGDAGLPTEIAWTLPPGFTAGDIVWPVPDRFVVDGLGNYGYRDAVDLLVPIAASQNVDAGDELGDLAMGLSFRKSAHGIEVLCVHTMRHVRVGVQSYRMLEFRLCSGPVPVVDPLDPTQRTMSFD
jgi:hypothetical protein